MPEPIIVTLFRPETSGGAWLVIPNDESRPAGRWTPERAIASGLLKELRGESEGRFEVELVGSGSYQLQVRRRLASGPPRDPDGNVIEAEAGPSERAAV